jgi:membrane protein required for colicin V production
MEAGSGAVPAGVVRSHAPGRFRETRPAGTIDRSARSSLDWDRADRVTPGAPASQEARTWGLGRGTAPRRETAKYPGALAPFGQRFGWSAERRRVLAAACAKSRRLPVTGARTIRTVAPPGAPLPRCCAEARRDYGVPGAANNTGDPARLRRAVNLRPGCMNILDGLVIGFTLLAIVMGFRSGLLRAVATIMAYLVAAPTAIPVTAKLAPLVPQAGNALFFWVVLALGLVLGVMMRAAVTAMFGETVTLPDRFAGALLGALRTALLAVLMVLIFERIIPPNVQPPWLTQSKLRPYLSAAGQRGVRALPPDVMDYIDRIKRERGI